MIILKVEKKDEGQVLQKFLKAKITDAPFTLIQKFFRKKLVKVNGKRVNKDFELKASDEISLPDIEQREGVQKKFPPIISRKEIEDNLLANIIYENDKILVINKPQGIPSQGGSKVRLSIDVMLKNMEEEWGYKTHIVHRLDKDTTGILIIAKDAETASLLGQKFKDREIEKTYLAICVGKLEPMQGIINYKIGKKTGQQEKMDVDEINGKEAITEYKVREYFDDIASLVELKPKTGRKHQLRVHLNALGHPIMGDGKYGGKKAFIESFSNKLHLHAWKIRQISGVMDKNIEILPSFETRLKI